jgi:hypothetical protein
MADETQTDASSETSSETLQPFFFDVAEIDGSTIGDIFGDAPDAQQYFDLFGRDLLTKAIVQTPQFSVFHETAKPGEQVKPHRHGTQQVNYILRGELNYGNRKLTPGMGAFTPDTLYAWRAGDDGAEWIEIHAGSPGIFTDRPG